MKRLAALVAIIVMFASSLSGCSTVAPTSPPAKATTPTPANSENINGLKLPISATGETITIMCTQGEASDTNLNDPQSFPVLAEIMRRTGLTLKIQASTSDNYGNMLFPLLASGQNLPDAFILSGADLVSMGKDGTIINLQPLMAKDCPNTMKILDQYPLVKYSITAPGGEIWGYPNRVAPGDEKVQGLTLGYRLDWITKLESEGKLKMSAAEPRTIDDWHAMLTAFLKGDPNGNGKQDETPFAVWSFNQLYCFAQAYGMSGMLSGWFTADKNGKVTFDWTNPNGRAREWVMLMNQWYKEKLLDQDILMEHGDASQAQLLGDQVGAEVTWTGTFAGMQAQMAAKYPNAVWMVSLPPEGPYGNQRYETYPYVNSERWMITNSAKDPDAILKLFDYLFATDEGQILNNFGIEGQTYTVQGGKPVLDQNVVVEGRYKDPSIYMAAQGTGKITDFVRADFESQLYANQYSADLFKRMGELEPYIEYRFPDVVSTSAESMVLKGLNDINSTVNEYMQKFVTGSLEISDYNWAEFQNKLASEGIDGIIRTKQDQYNRFYGK